MEDSERQVLSDLQVRVRELMAENESLSARNKILETKVLTLDWASVLDYFEREAFTREEEFLERFVSKGKCELGPVDLAGIWFASSHVKFHFIVEDGMHVTDTIELNEFLIWLVNKSNSQK